MRPGTNAALARILITSPTCRRKGACDTVLLTSIAADGNDARIGMVSWAV